MIDKQKFEKAGWTFEIIRNKSNSNFVDYMFKSPRMEMPDNCWLDFDEIDEPYLLQLEHQRYLRHVKEQYIEKEMRDVNQRFKNYIQPNIPQLIV